MIKARGFSFELDAGLTEGNFLVFSVHIPDGRRVDILGEFELHAGQVNIRQFGIYGVGFAARDLGPSVLREMARAALEGFDVQIIRIDGARRTSGANPGRTVGSIAFRRKT
jgi:hypothetical protein